MPLPQASTMLRLCRKYSALSLPPTTASRLPCAGGFQNSGLAVLADAWSSRNALLMEVPTSGGRSNSPEIAQAALTRLLGSEASNAVQSVASMQAARWPPAEWPLTTRGSPSFASSRDAIRICVMMSATVTAGQRSYVGTATETPCAFSPRAQWLKEEPSSACQ